MSDQSSDISDVKVTRGKKPQYSEEQRKQHYQEYRASQLSIEQYCHLNKMSQSALRKWIKKFESKAFFTAVKAKPSINHLTKQSLEVISSNGVRLRFPELVDLGVIKQLIREVNS
jgi:transposase-like protein